MVGDAFDRLGEEGDLKSGADSARVFHHVGNQQAHDALKFLVDGSIAPNHLSRRDHVEPCKGVECFFQHLLRQGADVPCFVEAQMLKAFRGLELLRTKRNLLHLVADPLKIVHRLHGADDLAQIDRRRLPFGDHFHALAVELDLGIVDALLLAHDRLDQLVLAGGDRRQRPLELRLDQATHRQQAAAQVFQFQFKLFGGMFHEIS